MNVTVESALHALRPDSLWSVEYKNDGSWEIHWQSDGVAPTKSEIDDEIDRQMEEQAAIEYRGLRATEYPSLAEQFDLMYWDAVNGTDNWQQTIASIKEKYPKPGDV